MSIRKKRQIISEEFEKNARMIFPYRKSMYEITKELNKLLEEGLIDYSFCRVNESHFDMESLGFERLATYEINKDKARAVGFYRPRKPPSEPSSGGLSSQ